MKIFDKGKITDILALTPMQEGMLFHYLKEPGSDYYFEQLSVKVSGNLDIHCFERAWHIVSETNEMLRTVFRWEKLEKPVQVVLKESPINLEYHDFANEPEGINKGRLEEVRVKDRRKAFDLREVPFRVTLCRIEQGRYEIIISNHHILYDGWSTGIILKEFLAVYTDLVNKQSPAKPVKTPFKEFVKKTLSKDRVKKEETFWKKHLEGFDTPLEFSIKKRPGKEKKSREIGNYQVTIDKDIKDRLERYGKGRKITSAALLYSAWGILLQKYNHTNDAIFGTTVSGRNIQLKGIEDMVGLFINTVPLRVKVIPGEKVMDFLIRINLQMKEREEYEHSPLVDIKGYSDIGTNEEMFDTVLVIENYPLDQRLKQENSALSFDSHSIFERSHYDLTLGITLGDQVVVRFYYQEELFNHADIRRLSQHYSALIENLIDNPGQEIIDIDMLSRQEKRQILVDFNAANTDYPRDKTIHQLFEQQVAKTPDNIAVIGIEHGAHHLSYRELNEISDQLAYLLIRKGVGLGVVAAIMLERSVEMIIGILATLKAGGAYLPIDPAYPGERIHYMLADSSAKVLITTQALIETVGKAGWWEGKKIFMSRAPSDSLPAPCSLLPAGPGSLAYIMYTSGTTGKPKGVMVEHWNTVNLVYGLLERIYKDYARNQRVALVAPYIFDASVQQIFAVLLLGHALYIVPENARVDGGDLIEFYRKFRIEVSDGTPGHLRLMLGISQDEPFEFIVKHFLIGGEALPKQIVEAFLNHFPPPVPKITNLYGPTECCVDSTSFEITKNILPQHKGDIITIGTPIANASAYIVDMTDHFVPVGVPGELLVGGDGVGRGYLNNPGLTAGRFIRINRSYRSYRSYISYRTGDLARWLPDGNIDFLGRIDHQVKIRGFRIELEEIRSLILKHENIEDVAVIARSDETGENHMCAYVVPASSPGAGSAPIPQLRDWLAEKLPGYMIPTHFIALEQLPLTPNGKLDRRALPLPEIISGKAYQPPGDEQQQALAAMWSEVLGIEKEKIGIDDDFFELGGHSLKATGLIGRIHKTFDVKIPLAQLFKSPTIRGLSLYMADMDKDRHSPIEPVEKKEFYTLSSPQKRLFVIYRMDPSNITYNMPGIMKLEGWLERKRLEQAFKKLIYRHESLRTSFEIIDEEPIQKIHKEVEFRIDFHDLTGTPNPTQHVIESFVSPFDLSQSPLLRVGLIETGEDEHLLMVDMHHIISDGVSVSILMEEFTAFYLGKEMPELSLQYKDFSHWQNQRLTSTKMKQQEAYWREQFEGEIPVLDLPTDYVRPSVQQFEGGRVRFEVGEAETAQLRQLTLATGTTPFMVLLAVFNVMLSKLSSQEDIVVGTPAAGRSHRDLENIIGIFINTLVLRNYPSTEKPFCEFLQEVKESCLTGFENQDYQYEDLVEAVVIDRDLSRNSLFDVMLVLQNMERQQVKIPGLTLETYEYQEHTSKFDLTLTAVEEADQFKCFVTYSTALFKENTIQRFVNYFKCILDTVLEDSQQRLSEIDVLPDEEKERLLKVFNATDSQYPEEKTIHQLFEEQAGRTADKIALISREHGARSREGNGGLQNLSYRELNKKANQLARVLRKKGVGPDAIVGLMVDPAMEMVIGILSILKAGGAYLPIDPMQPEERITYMLEDSRAAALLTNKHLSGTIPFTGNSLFLDDTPDYKGDTTNLTAPGKPGHVVYTIYTSGTTGKSKGALITNENLVNYVCWFRKTVNLTGGDRALLTSSFGFDLGYTSIYSSLLTGCQLHIIPREVYLSPEDVIGYIHRQRITYLKMTPSLFSTLVESSAFSPGTCRTLRLVVLGGEEIKPKDVEKAHIVGPHIKIMNHYGPTEATIGCVSQFIDFNRFEEYVKRPTIGQPIANMKVAVLDKELRLVPTGVPGELCISGDGVIRGYLNHPELTAERFIRINRSYRSYRSYISYRTGDLARWLPEGTIEFLGRFDTQVKIRGYRIELGEIENRLLGHETVKEAVVVDRKQASGDRYLCAYIVWNRIEEEANVSQLKEYLSGTLPDYMIPSYFVTLERIPLTPNGKLNGKLLPEPEVGITGTDYTAPRDRVEERLAELWLETLEPAVEPIGIDDNFFQKGGHSLKAIMLVSRIHKALDVKVALTEIFKTPTIRGLSAHIKNIKASPQDRYIAIEPVEKKEYYSLSSAQKRLFILHRFDEMGTGYNMPRVVDIEGDLDRNRLGDTFKKLIDRHESLRTSFEVIDGEPVQKIHESDGMAFEIEYYQALVNGQCSLAINNFIRPFDLAQAPLLRVGLINGAAGGGLAGILMVDMHHIISDAVSRDLFIRDFMALYSGEVLPDLEIRYKDYSDWQNREKQGDEIKQQEDFWIREFEGEAAVLHLPTDYPRPAVQSFEGKQVRFHLDNEESDALRKLAMEEKATLYMVLITIYNILLSKISGQEDIVVGFPIVGRRHADLEQVIGMFINTLALRNYPSTEKRFNEFLREVRERTLTALENQDYPFEDLVDKLAVNRDASRNPLFDVMFVMQDTDIKRIEVPKLKLNPRKYESGISKFDLTFGFEEINEKLLFSVDYSTKLFAERTIIKFTKYFKKIVSTVLNDTDGDIRIGEIEIISGEERRQLLYDFNDTQAEYPVEKRLHEIFTGQVEKSPDNIALIFKDIELTYRKLNERTDKLAAVLIEKGVTSGSIAALMAERSVEMIVGILAILKAGAAYLPIDPEYPAKRIQYMVEDSGSQFLLIHGHLLDRIEFRGTVIKLDKESIYTIYTGSPPQPEVVEKNGDAAYVIYTSGSTGNPKGVLVEHFSVVNLAFSQKAYFNINVRDRVLQFSSLCFDASVEQIFITLFSGAVLALIDKDTLLENSKFEAFISCRSITHIHAVPSFLSNIRLKDTSQLKRVISGGDVCPVPLAKKWSRYCNFYNEYGPTETTVTSIEMMVKEVDEALPRLPVGRPINNTTVYVFDKWLKLVPPGVVGELYIGGEGVARGYLNRPELTSERFITNPLLGGERLYRTGDLVRRLTDGHIEFLGRLDHQVKIRGFRIELGEIETQLLAHERIEACIVLPFDDKTGDKYLCGYIVLGSGAISERDLSISRELKKYLSHMLPGYMIPSYFVQLEQIPLTPSGKVDRRALPGPELKAEETYVAPGNEIEEKLAEIWSGVLGIEKGVVGIDDNFFKRGGHSLKATLMVSKIHRAFDVKVPLAEIFKSPTIRGLSIYIKEGTEDKCASVGVVEKREYYALSSAQKRLYVTHQMVDVGTGYNMPTVVQLQGMVEKERLEHTFRQLIARHESLRTSFEMVNGKPVQKVHKNIVFEIRYHPLTPDPLLLIADFIRPFDLSKAPLLRVGLLKEDNTKHILVVDMHHIISDGVSMGILMREFMVLYADQALSPLRSQYKDYAQWQKEEKQSTSTKKQGHYWLKQLGGDIPVLQLPTDYARPMVQSFEGSRLSFYLEEKESQALKQLVLKQEATLYMILMALYNILLSKLSGQEDIVVGSPIAGRRHADLEQIIGMFVNTLPLRNYPLAGNRFSEFLRDVRERTLMALENQDYPFEDLVDKVAVKRDISRNPLFDVVFVMQNEEVSEIRLPGLTLTPLSYERGTSKFDITFIAFEAGKGLGCLIEYGSKLFKEDSIRRFINYFKKIVSDILEHPDIKLSDIEIISEAEKRQILVDFNNTAVDYPEDKTLHRLFADQVAQTPDGIAVKGMARSTQWTYRQLDRLSNHLAELLIEKGAKPGSIVGIIGGRSPEMVGGILGILKTGGVYLPIDADYPAQRQRYMLDDSHAGIVVREVSEGLEIIAGEHLCTHPLSPSPTQLAYIMYTSGSTGRPKGVLVTHRNVVRLVKESNYVLLDHETRVLQTGAPVFDAATFEIWGSLLNGGQLVLTSKEVILDAHRLGDALEVYRINTLWLSAPLFNQLMQQNIDLFSPLRYLLVGGDILSPVHISRVRQKFPQLNIINGYGPTENTTFSTTYLIDKGFEQNIPIGSPIANSTAYIVDRNSHLLPIGIYGELLVGGDGLSLGYLNNPELTAEKFNFNRSYRSYRSYKTGDLARWLPDGNIEFSGRIDQQVKIRGFRVEPGEIEDHLLKLEGVKATVVIPVQDEKGNKSLCAYIVADNEIPVTGLRNALSRQLPDYMIPSYFTFLEKIPLTPNGKVDRKSLPVPRAGVTGVYVAPRNEIEKQMAEVWSGVLGIESETIGIDSDFFEMGGDSLKATVLVSKIHQAFNVKIPLAQVFQSPVIRGLTEYMNEAVEETFLSIEPVGKKDNYLLSSAQRRLYILQQVEPESTAYHISTVVRLAGDLEKEKLEHVFIQLIHRHESLRTSFAVVDDEAVQKIHEDVAFEIEYVESDRLLWSVIHDFVQPFDLSAAPLLRVRLIKEDNTCHLLMVDMHHIISDGTSMAILFNEVMALYNGEMLPALSIQYKDFSEWQNSAKERESIKQQEGFWLREFEGEIPILDLPIDYERPVVQVFEGSLIGFELGTQESRVLQQFSLSAGVTLYMFLLALFNILLAKISSQEEIVVGTPVAGRRHAELQPLIGVFINTLPLKNHPLGEKTFNEFLKEIREKTLAAFANQEYPYEDLVDRIVAHRDASRNPLFDVLFAFQNVDISEMEIPGLKLLPYDYERKTSKFDLSLYGYESGEKLAFAFEYSTNLFERETVESFIRYFKRLTAAVLENSRQRIADIEILSEAEKQQLLEGFNATEAAYPQDKTLHELFEQRSAGRSNKIAVLGMGGHQLTYGQLNEKSHQLAEMLTERGVTPNTIVGIKTGRSLEMVIGIFGILRAGGAYLPMDPAYPAERIDYILQDSGAKILLSEVSEVGFDIEVIDLNKIIGPIGPIGPMFKKLPTHPWHLCYIIYTSGSTGNPKGVMVEHGSVVNIVFDLFKRYPFGEVDTYLLKTSYVFDVSVTELFGWFLGGGRLALLEKGGEKDPHRILDAIAQYGISHINFVPSMFTVFLEILTPGNSVKLSGLKYIFLAGEALLPWLVKKFQQFSLDIVLENIYGPTEATVYASQYSLAQWEGTGNIPIGKPMQNTRLYILSRRDGFLPPGVVGELCISGIGLARGYLNNPELTAETFTFNRSYKSYRTYIFYKTGDLARWLPDGNVEYLGRSDHQIKIRGFRVELGEIENRLLMHHEIKEAVVVAGERNGDTYLCAYIVPNSSGTVDDISSFGGQIKRYLSRSLPDYMIPSYIMPVEAIPLTPSGKIDRKALPEPEVQAAKTYTAPRENIEEKLAEIWADVLGIEKRVIGIDNNFFQLGGHSLKATIMAARVHKAFDIRLPLARVFKAPFIRGLAEYIKNTGEERYTAVTAVEKNEYYPLSSAQKRLYLLYRFDTGNTGYNMPTVVRLKGMVEKERLEHTFRQLIARHESLRTSFEMVDEEPVQKIHQNVPFEIEYYESSSLSPGFIRPFDLSQVPLLRVRLVKEDDTKHILMVDMHHIISDGISVEIFVKEFMMLYGGEALPPLYIRYKDYARWQNHRVQSIVVKSQEAYWLKEMAGEIPTLELPLDYPRPAIKKSEGSRLDFAIDPAITDQLKRLALETGSTSFMVLLAVFNFLLAKLSGQEDIIVGTPAAGRPHNDLQHIIGVFINTLVLRNYPSPDKPFSQFLAEVKENCLKAFENQDYQYEDLVEAVVTDRDLSRNSLFDVMLVFQNMARQQLEIPGLKLIPYDYESVTSKFDITLTAAEDTDRFKFFITYSTALFEKNTIKRFVNYFKRILTTVLKDSGRGFPDIDILSGDEKSRLLYDFNAADKDYPKEKTIHRLFEEQAEKTPHNIALVGRSLKFVLSQRVGYISYKTLGEESDQLARLLIEKGVSPGTIIGIMVEASLEMVIAILAILKAGGAYLPIDPGYPQKRMHFMLKDSSAGVLLSGVSKVTGWEGEIVCLGNWMSEVSKVSGNFPTHLTHLTHPTQLCYVIYTSGSSGRSKGVLVRHRNVMNLLVGLKEKIYNGCTRYLRVALVAPIGFDASVKQIFGALLQGHGLYIIPGTVRLDGSGLWSFFKQYKIDITDGTPAHLYMLCEVPVDKNSLETGCYPGHFVVGGEAVSPGLVERFLNCFAKTRCPKITNIYGPTECTVDSTSFDVPVDNLESFTHIPIGKPLPNQLVYILGPGDGLQPIGVPGELYIGGEGVARGYLNQPELTAEKFVISHQSLVSDNSTNDQCPMTNDKLYRTGDRVRWLPDGNIEFLGRIDRQVKIRGYRIEPGEIESRLLLYNGIKDAVVITKQDNTAQNYLCAYITAGGDFSKMELIDHLTAVLPNYMVPSYVVQLEKFPLTPNGKLNRKLLPEPETGAAAAGYAAPRGHVEKKLVLLWQELLGIEPIGINDHFFQCGGHSLKAILLVNKIRKQLNAGIDLTDVFKYPTLSALAAHIKEIKNYSKGEPAPIPPAEEKEYYPLSSTQKRLYLLHQSDRRSTGYNIPEMLMLEGKLEKERLEKTFKQLVRRHESFRTSFEQVKGEAVQRIHKENSKFQITGYKGPGGGVLNGGLQDIIKNFVSPFDLSQAPLLRVGLIKITEEQHVLAVDMHHIVSDGASIGLLVREFTQVYEGEPLPRPLLHYKDYAQWQCSAARQESLEAAETYWLGRFTGKPLPRLKLPTDFPRPSVQSFEGAVAAFELPPEQTAALKQVANEAEVTLYMVTLALFNILLGRLSGQEDIIVGTPVLGRSREELHHIIGMFVNTLALRNFPRAECTFSYFLKEVKEHTLNAFEYQDYPFEKLVEKVGVERDNNRNPLFDVMFVLQNPDTPEFHIPGLTLKPYPYEGVTAKFDLNWFCTEKDDTLSFKLEYSTKLFKADTIERFVHYFKDIVITVLENRDIRLGDIKIALELSESESALALEAEGDFAF